MKICPACQKTYRDEGLNFCLNDGTTLINYDSDNAPPTVMMDSPRTTEQTSWQDFGFNTSANSPGNIQPTGNPNQMFPVAGTAGNDQTLPIIALILGAISFLTVCCYGGIPFGIGAIVVGYLGMNNANNNPMKYTGKKLAVAGIALGALSFVLAILFLFLGILSNIFN